MKSEESQHVRSRDSAIDLLRMTYPRWAKEEAPAGSGSGPGVGKGDASDLGAVWRGWSNIAPAI